MMITGGTKVIAGGDTLFKWVMQSSASKLNHEDQKAAIQPLQRYFFKEIRNVTSQLIQRCYLRVVHPDQVKKDDAAKAHVQKNMGIYEDHLLPSLEGHLDKQKKQGNEYLTGANISFVDFLVYCEMFQIKSLYDRQVPN